MADAAGFTVTAGTAGAAGFAGEGAATGASGVAGLPSSIGLAGPAGRAGEAGTSGFSAATEAAATDLPGWAGLAGPAGAVSWRLGAGALDGVAGAEAPSVLAGFPGAFFLSPAFVAAPSAASILVGPENETLPFRPSTTFSCRPGTFFRSRSDLNRPFCCR
ncbi:hypothetical protein SDC9_206372 [bioreactor metagenome]|uniref:Uncharacterized protein n=1 Tax=bioreactor metagenome TaxID=1076179 RepID=A0A645J4U3_9ZZZZ